MKKEQILVEIYNSNELSKCLLCVKKESLREDIKQEIFIKLFEKEESFIQQLHANGKLKAYISTCIFNEIYSPRSTTRKKLGKESVILAESVSLDNITIFEIEASHEAKTRQNKEVLALNVFENLPESDLYKKIFLLLDKFGSYRKLSKAINIPHTTLRDMVTTFTNDIKKQIT
jgi:DNA-directed RNA polymerase specialized sigma24 family protein